MFLRGQIQGCTHMHILTCVWKPEVSLRCGLSEHHPTLFCEVGSLAGPELTEEDRLGGQ